MRNDRNVFRVISVIYLSMFYLAA